MGGWKPMAAAYMKRASLGSDYFSRQRPPRPPEGRRTGVTAGGGLNGGQGVLEREMRRVVVTGMGIVSSLGNNSQQVLASLREAKSGIVRADQYVELGFKCQVHGAPTLDPGEAVDRRAMRFHGAGTAWNHIAMDQAIRDARLEPDDVSNDRTGLIMGSC